MRSKIVNWQQSLSMRQRIYLIVALFILVNLALFSLSYIQSEAMNGVRGYVRGEGLWGKAQKNATLQLERFIYLGKEDDYQLFLKSLEVPLGDRQARLQLQSEQPDLQMAFQGFLAGQNDPQDIPGLIVFFQRFEHFPYMSDAIEIWTQGDRYILQLKAIGEQVYLAKTSGDEARIESLLPRLQKINLALERLEYQFSLVLSEGARWVKRTLMSTSLVLFVLMLAVVMYVNRRILRSIEQTEAKLNISENRFSSLYSSNIIGIIDWNSDGTIIDANDAFLNMFGYSREDFQPGSINWREMTPESARDRDELALAEIATKGHCTPFEKELIHKNGRRVSVYLGAALLGGESEKGIGFFIDHTEQKRAQAETQLSATVFEASNNGIMITDADRVVIAVNRSWCDMTLYAKQEVLGKHWDTLLTLTNSEPRFDDIWNTAGCENSWQGDLINRRKDGSEFPVHLSINTVHDSQNNISHYVVIFTDSSERVATEQKLRDMAHYDFLTGLANRSLLHELIKQTVTRANCDGERFATLFLDLDRFKPVNDLYGHEVGDRLIQVIASRLKHCVREDDIVARLGGDEFVIILQKITDPTDAAKVANKLISSICHVVVFDDLELKVGCSIGISIYPEDGSDHIELLRCADSAMYQAKSAGRNRFCYYSNSSCRLLTP